MIVNFRNKLINFFLTSDYEAGSKVLNFLTWENYQVKQFPLPLVILLSFR